MFVHFHAGEADTQPVPRTVSDGLSEGPGPEAFTVQFDYATNGPNVQSTPRQARRPIWRRARPM